MLQERSQAVRATILAKAEHLGDGFLTDMQAAEQTSTARLQQILDDKNLSDAERKKQLLEEERRFHEEVKVAEAAARQAAREAEKLKGDQQETFTKADEEVTKQSNDVKETYSGQSKAELMARAQENDEVGTMYTHAEVMVDTLDHLKR